jgi:hypothetical protein
MRAILPRWWESSGNVVPMMALEERRVLFIELIEGTQESRYFVGFQWRSRVPVTDLIHAY